MMRLLLHVVTVMLVLMTCNADRLRKLEKKMKLMRAFEIIADKRLDTLEADVGSITDRVAKLESLVNEPDDDIDSKRSRAEDNLSNPNVKHELNSIKSTLKMYRHSFSKQKQEFINVNYVIKDTLSVFEKNSSSVVNNLVNIVNDHVKKSAANMSATLEQINNATVESGGLLRSEILTCLENISSEVKTDMHIHVEGIRQDSNKTVYAIKYQVHDHLANETKRLDQFKANVLLDVYAIRSDVQNKTNEIEKKIEDLIGRANEVVGIIDDKRSTIEEDIMVTIRELHRSWSDWSAWSDCSQTCDWGSRRRHRTCSAPPPLTDAICIGNTETEEEECVIHEFCPYLNEWSPWSQCSQTCGNGTITRDRICLAPASLHSTCHGDMTESQTCMIECPHDCSDVLKQGISRGSGVYKITPWNTHREVEVYCDMETDGGGWTVFQRRYNGSVGFNRGFSDYEQGFGALDGEFWMGLGLLQSITSRGNMTLHIDMSLPSGTTGFDEYSGFYISPPDRYNFNVDGRINSRRMTNFYLLSDTGDGGDINHQPFSTYDRDVDSYQGGNCAQHNGGGWWFNYCAHNNLNGPYNSAYYYYGFLVKGHLLKTSTMMFRSSN